jgi:TonB family protein
MESNRKKDRTSISLVLSTILHGSVIALVALGPAFLPGMLGDKNASPTPSAVEFTVDNNTPISQPIAESPVVTKIQPQTSSDIQPVKQPVAKVESTKPEPKLKVKPAKKPVVVKEDKLPEKIEAEPALVVDENTGDAQPTVEETPTPVEEVAKIEEKIQEPELVEEKVQEEPIREEVAPVAQAIEQKDGSNEAAQSTTAAQEQQPVATSTAPAQSPAPQTETIQVTQNYLELRQLPGNKAPNYTSDMRLKQLQGRGQLVYFVTKNGQVGDIRLVKSTGSSELDNAAVDAFKKYKFVPGQEGYTLHEFEFVLKGPAEANRARLRTSAK